MHLLEVEFCNTVDEQPCAEPLQFAGLVLCVAGSMCILLEGQEIRNVLGLAMTFMVAWTSQ